MAPFVVSDVPTITVNQFAEAVESFLPKPKAAPGRKWPPLPETSVDRLLEASPGVDTSSLPSSKTVLYLAYGSNMASKVLRGRRGIRPLSKVNVTAPTLQLTFDLPCIPYVEPCFANTAIRKVPDVGSVDATPAPAPSPAPSPPATTAAFPSGEVSDWDQGLIGVAFEVTRKDFDRILQTEGGGASYIDIVVPCFTMPDPNPALPTIPRTILVHTLLAPRIPIKGDRWWLRWLQPLSRAPGSTQPSPRYLNLLIDGAAENSLPAEYQTFLQSLTPYRLRSWRQVAGRAVFLGCTAHMGILFGLVIPRLAPKNGLFPPWVQASLNLNSNVLWAFYDYVCKPLFGDGERTVPDQKKQGEKQPLLAASS